jgi:hypothetical protein
VCEEVQKMKSKTGTGWIRRLIQSDQGARAFVWSVWLVMLLVALGCLTKYGHNIPFSEDWWLVSPLTGNEPSLTKWFWIQNNEHRIPFPKLILLVLLKIANGDVRVGMLFNIFILGSLALAMFYIARRIRGGRTSFADAFFPIALLHLGNWENMFWSWQLTQIVPTVLACVILLTLVSNQTFATPRATIIAGISLMLLPLSGANGLIFVPIMALWLSYCGFRQWRASKMQGEGIWPGAFLMASAVIALGLTGLYFIGFTRPVPATAAPGLGASLMAAMQFLALGFGPVARSSWTLSIAAALAILGPSTVVAIRAILRQKDQERYRTLGILLFFGNVAIYALAIGWGRAEVLQLPAWGGVWPTRYVLLAVPALITAFFIWELYGSIRFRAVVQYSLFLGMLVLIPFNTIHGRWWYDWYLQGVKPFEEDLLAEMSRSELIERHQNFLLTWMQPNGDKLQMLHDAGIAPFTMMRKDDIKPGDSTREVVSTASQAQPLENDINARLVTRTIKFEMSEASEVYLEWGLNGWHVAPMELRPAGTEIKNNLMFTPMVQEGNTFVAKVSAPIGTLIDYGFLVTKKRDSYHITWPVWDGDYQEKLSENGVTRVKTKLNLTLVSQEIRYDIPEAKDVDLVWGLNGWHVAPEELRPVGTEIKSKVMHTPMTQEGDIFIAKIWLPIGTKIDYGFQITERRGLFNIVYPVWDGGDSNYQQIVLKDDVIEVKPTLILPNELSAVLDKKLYFLAGLGLLLISWLVLYFSLGFVDTGLVKASHGIRELGPRRVIFLSSMLALVCIGIGLFFYRATPIAKSQDDNKISSITYTSNAGDEQTRLVSQEFHYQMPEAGEVFLVWGIKGWLLMPEEQRPAGTVVESGVMHTPMVLKGDTFTAKLRIPVGTPIDYGFQTRKTRSGATIKWVWDGDYRLIPSKDNIIETQAAVTLARSEN